MTPGAYATSQPVRTGNAGLDVMLNRPTGHDDIPTNEMLQNAGRKVYNPNKGLTFDQLPVAANQEALPKAIHFRDNHEGFNRELEFCLNEGLLYVRHRNAGEPWREIPMPESLKGKVVAMSIDCHELEALDEDNWIYSLFGLGKEPENWTWATCWGELFRLGRGYQLPNRAEGQWAMSHVDPQYDDTYLDGDDNVNTVGLAGCTQIYYTDPDDDTSVLYADPWLPGDKSRNIGSPMHSRFHIQSLSASASCTFVTNKYGDMFTRLYDYDIGGGDVAFFHYSWEPLPGNQKIADGWWEHFLVRNTSDVRLPAPYWVKQPKIPGEITDRLTVWSTDPGMQNRRLVVEGRKDGTTGYWTKMLRDNEWNFVETGEPLKGTLLQNTLEDTSAKDLAPESGIHYRGSIRANNKDTGVQLLVRNFAYNDSRQEVELVVDQGCASLSVPAMLYYEHGNLGHFTTQIITHREAGLNDTPRYYRACLMLDDSAVEMLSSDPAGRKFLKTFMKGKNIRPLSLQATQGQLLFADDRQWSAKELKHPFVLHRI
ncbi:MAG: hypothetical protein IJ133_03665 [Clostridia bacterium]|nr:hypothetical protein [Clostridia bacterium]